MKILTVITDNYDSETIVGESPANLTFEEKIQLIKDMGIDLEELIRVYDDYIALLSKQEESLLGY